MRSLATLIITALLTQSTAPAAGPWISLFDGKSMDAWRPWQ